MSMQVIYLNIYSGISFVLLQRHRDTDEVDDDDDDVVEPDRSSDKQ